MSWTITAIHRSLIARLVGLSLLLLLLVQAAGFAVVRASIDRNARSQIARALDTDENIWRHLLARNAERLRQGATLLAADYGFRSAVHSDDLTTIESALGNHGQRLGATVIALLDPQMQWRVVSGDRTDFQAGLAQVLPALSSAPSAGQVAVLGGVPYQFVLVPLRAPLLVGWVLVGFAVDQALVDEMRQLLAVDVALRVRTADAGWAVPVSTLSASDVAGLRQAGDTVTELDSDNGILLARTSHLAQVGGHEIQALLLRSVEAVVAPYQQLQILLAVITALGLFLFAVGSGLMARRVTMPLRSLVLGTERLARGEYDVPVEHTDRTDEIGNLARSFDHMRLNIAEQQAQIRHLAYWDRLTGLPNRERFRDMVLQAITSQAVRSSAALPVSVITLDLDRFKHVNDVLGYTFGDQLLQVVADRLRQQVSAAGEVVARLGGNEFALLLRTDKTVALEVARRIAQSFETPLAFEDQTVDLSAGMGIACWPTDAEDVDTLLSHSEIAMYASKRRLDGPQCYDPTLDSASAQNLSLLSELRRAVEQDELRLYLQPKISLRNQPGLAAEALVRWQHPQRGLVPPGEFIPFAEQTGFVRQLTLWMFQAAARVLATEQAQQMGLRISVNLSTRDLLDPELSQRLGVMLERHQIEASAFCLEITESAIMDDPQRAEVMLNRLSEQGFKLSIDDFGTGYSSLGYLKRLPVNELKIDQSFVMGMQSDDNDATIVRSTIDLAHNLNLSVVAEGVENAVIMELLRALACDEAQGYHISRPLPVEAFFAWYDQQTI